MSLCPFCIQLQVENQWGIGEIINIDENYILFTDIFVAHSFTFHVNTFPVKFNVSQLPSIIDFVGLSD